MDNIVSDAKDLALIEEMGGDEKMKEMSSKYADYLRNLSREVAVARW